jgi:lysophospholipase L1-like esterase
MRFLRPCGPLATLLLTLALAGAALPRAGAAQQSDAASLSAPAAITAPTTQRGAGSEAGGAPGLKEKPASELAVPPAAGPALAAVAPGDSRWDESLAAFAAADKAHPPTPGGVLFVGSSSIRLWNGLETEFQSLPVVVKRGFGGSRMLDCTRHLHQLVEPYRPRLVLVYAGDNDLAEGRTPEQVLQAFSAFVEGVRRTLPSTRIAYISIKPSPSRVALMPSIRAANDLIRAYTLKMRNTDFIDVYTPMLDARGQPRPELFREDLLHLNTQGYSLWKQVITAHLN